MRAPELAGVDAVIAAVGALCGFCEADHAAIARPRENRKGRMHVG